MQKFIRYFFLLLLATAPFLCHANQLNKKTMALVLAANMPEINNTTGGGYPQLAMLLEKIRSGSDSSLFIFGGGSLGPSALSSFDRGSHVIDILNTIEPDFMTLEKREFSYSEEEISLRSYEAAFPFVCSNLINPSTNKNLEGVSTHLVVEKGGVKIGIISILDDDTADEYILKRIKTKAPKDIVNQQIDVLRKQGADWIVLIFSKEDASYSNLLWSKKIDIALSTSRKPEMLFSKGLSTHPHFFTLNADKQVLLLNINWTFSDKKSFSIEKKDIHLEVFSKETPTALLVKDYRERLSRLLSQRIGTLSVKMDTRKEPLRKLENSFGNFVADALRESTNTEIAIINSGSIRGNRLYEANSILTKGDIVRELPYRERIVVLQLTGKQILAVLENGVSQVEGSEGRFPQVSGIEFSFSAKKQAFNRINSVTFRSKPLNQKQKYSVAVTGYIAKGGDGYNSLKEALTNYPSPESPLLLSDVVTRAIQEKKTISPTIDGRITSVE